MSVGEVSWVNIVQWVMMLPPPFPPGVVSVWVTSNVEGMCCFMTLKGEQVDIPHSILRQYWGSA